MQDGCCRNLRGPGPSAAGLRLHLDVAEGAEEVNLAAQDKTHTHTHAHTHTRTHARSVDLSAPDTKQRHKITPTRIRAGASCASRHDERDASTAKAAPPVCVRV